MNAMESLRQWTAAVKDLLSPLHGHTCKAIAHFSFAMVLCGRCDSGHVPLAMFSQAKPASQRRRMERFLSNPRLSAAHMQSRLIQRLTENWNQPLVLILDETPKGNDLRCMKISLAYRHRSVPLAWECYPREHPPVTMPRLLSRLCRRVARMLPKRLEVTLLVDRGLSWPSLVDCCRGAGWHYVFRLQGSTRVKLNDGQEKQAHELVPVKGTRWLGRNVQVYKKAGWREANVVAVWEKRCKERWILVTDRHASYRRCSDYCRRMWCEELHRDEKSSGLNWQRSRVEMPSHATRLLLLLAMAVLLAVSIGTRLLKRGLRRMLESTRQRRLSIFQLGLRWLTLSRQQRFLPDMPVCIYLQPP